MIWFRKLRLQNKIIVLLIVPSIVLGFFLLRDLDHEWQNYRKAKAIAKLTEISLSINSLIHHFQMERGASVGYISTKGDLFNKKLKRSRDNVDITLKAFQSHFETSTSSPQVDTLLQSIEAYLSSLPQWRSEVDSHKASIGSTMESYSFLNLILINTLVEIQSRMSEQSFHNIVSLLGNLVRLKEAAGQERAYISALLTGDKKYKISWINSWHLTTQQQEFLSGQFSNISDPFLNKIAKTVVAAPNLERIKEIRRIIETENDASQIDPEHWFEIATNRIDAMHVAEMALARHIEPMFTRQADAALLRIQLMSVFAIFIITLIGFTYRMIRLEIFQSVRLVTDALANFEDNRESPKSLQVGPEIKSILDSIDHNYKQLRNTQKDLLQSMEDTEKASQAKTTFLANMSHELRTPLNAIIGYSEIIMKDSGADTSCQKDANSIYHSGVHLLNMINGVLDITKVESGAETLMMESVFLKQLTKEIRLITQPLAEKNNNKLTISLQEGLDCFRTDKQKLKKIILNLLSNGCKFCKNGEVHLDIRESHQNGSKGITISVKDNGMGMSKEAQQVIFDKFVQVHDTSNDNLAGTGLGLSICQSMVSYLRGTISVDSTVNKGAAFLVFLPYHSLKDGALEELKKAM